MAYLNIYSILAKELIIKNKQNNFDFKKHFDTIYFRLAQPGFFTITPSNDI